MKFHNRLTQYNIKANEAKHELVDFLLQTYKTMTTKKQV